MAVGLPEGPSYLRRSPHINHFLPCCPLNDSNRAARCLFKVGRLFSLLSRLFLARLLILLLLLMSYNVHSKPGLLFPCSVCAGNVTLRGRSVQCCTCSKWVHLRCSLLYFFRFKTLGSSHSQSRFSCLCRFHFHQHCVFLLGLFQLVYLHCTTWLSGRPLLMHSSPTLTFKPLIPLPPTLYLLPLCLHHRLMFLAVFLYFLLPLPQQLP